jgi:hypothetical protein
MDDKELLCQNQIIADFLKCEMEDNKIYIVIDGEICEFGLFTQDLNAIAYAEGMLISAQQCRDYTDILDDGNGGHFATAEQRANALIKIVGN